MNEPLINILIRTGYRPSAFSKCISSIKSQTYKNIRVLVSYDDDRAVEYIEEELEGLNYYLFPVHKTDRIFFYDDYVNILKQEVNDGYFFVLDDSDELNNSSCIEILARKCIGTNGLIVQFTRNGKIKPSNDLMNNKRISKSKIGMPCLVLSYFFKNIVDLDGSVGAADYHWIKEVHNKIKLKFVKHILVKSKDRDYGKMEA